MNAPRLQETTFSFDKQLWNRFIAIAQPYFFPLMNRGTPTFIGLIVLLFIVVIALAFFLVVGLTALGQFFFPEFFALFGAALVAMVDGWMRSSVPFMVTGILIFAGLVFYGLRNHLKNRSKQWLILGALLLLALVNNGVDVIFSYVFRFIETALNRRNEPVFWQFIWIMGGGLVALSPTLWAYKFIRMKLSRYWREWLAKYFIDRYFQDKAYYKLDSNAANAEIDNPDQRITEDVRTFTRITLTFLLDILDSGLILLSFTAVLYSISPTLTFWLLVYAIVGTAISLIAGKKLIKINYDQLRLEANFRYGLVHIRDNAESIAFYKGEGLEKRQIFTRLMGALKNYDRLIIWESIVELYIYGYNYFSRIAPYVVVAPLYFMGQAEFGAITQASIAFRRVLGAISVITNKIEYIAAFAAGVKRLGAFDEVLTKRELLDRRPTDEKIEMQDANSIGFDNLDLLTPNSEQRLIKDMSFKIAENERLLIVGASGCGKSSLLRAIAGLWDNGNGIIHRPIGKDILFLPQKPYMLLGSLKEQLVYPSVDLSIPDDTLHEALKTVNLEDLPDRFGGFDAQKDWTNVLSLGEQQRLAFARIFVSETSFVILDEATSALDTQNEDRLYSLLEKMGIKYLSVGHRTSLVKYHQNVVKLEGTDRWRLMTPEEYMAELSAA